MTTEMDRVWTRLKEAAVALATSRKPLALRSAREIVLQVFHEEQAFAPPSEALDYLAEELIQMVNDGGSAMPEPK